MKTNVNKNAKKSYAAPKLLTYGDIQSLTQTQPQTQPRQFDYNSTTMQSFYNKSINT